jgi:hypothetical protein
LSELRVDCCKGFFVGRVKPQATGFTKCEEDLGNTPSNSLLNKSDQVFTFMRNPKYELRVVLFSIHARIGLCAG